MNRLTLLGLTIAISTLGACSDDPPVTSDSASGNESSSDGSPTSAGTVSDSSGGSESGSASAGSSESEGGSESGGSSGASDTSSGSDGSSGDSAPESSSDDGSDTSVCEPLTEDASAIGQVCAGEGDCPDGYMCFDPGGIVANPGCHILCTQDCECPASHTCLHFLGKGIEWDECAPG
jgi:hypothetical protein